MNVPTCDPGVMLGAQAMLRALRLAAELDPTLTANRLLDLGADMLAGDRQGEWRPDCDETDGMEQTRKLI